MRTDTIVGENVIVTHEALYELALVFAGYRGRRQGFVEDAGGDGVRC